MIRNYLKIAWRNLFRNKVSTFINIGGLAPGMTVALLIGLWIWSEFSFDKQYRNHDRIARVMQNQIFSGGTGGFIDCFNNGELPGHQGGTGQPREKFEN